MAGLHRAPDVGPGAVVAVTDPTIVEASAVPADTTLIYRVTADDGAEQEAILVRLDDGAVVSWLNHCQHFRHIPLDKGDGAPMRDGEIVCTNHGAMFERDTGRCTFGPCEGAILDSVAVEVVDGAVRLVDEAYELAGLGPLETDGDLSSSSNVEF